jgi:hypothetical protein
MYTVFVTWEGTKRAERLANGYTTTKRIHATMFPTWEDAERAAKQALIDIPGVRSWRVAPF